MMTRKDYVATAEILKYASNKTHPALFSKMVNDFALLLNDGEVEALLKPGQLS